MRKLHRVARTDESEMQMLDVCLGRVTRRRAQGTSHLCQARLSQDSHTWPPRRRLPLHGGDLLALRGVRHGARWRRNTAAEMRRQVAEARYPPLHRLRRRHPLHLRTSHRGLLIRG